MRTQKSKAEQLAAVNVTEQFGVTLLPKWSEKGKASSESRKWKGKKHPEKIVILEERTQNSQDDESSSEGDCKKVLPVGGMIFEDKKLQ
ncbi:hypothetical protein TNIN_238481 [Trichonephila inaurata madagascariensis]|uniref:Uncharacterized protein n=1 Tax=Trichonephila inaurata madagascariensis TaxID=2747483 RepID=A0A8X6YRH1_9ARAC|nr:hypothetical protein TNIN_238481 [Trichonephila inaurata madagascariensis]